MSAHEYPTLRQANLVRQREWDTEGKITLAYRANELVGEMGEACNVLKKLVRESLGIAGSRATFGQLAEELADVVICTDLVAMDRGCDLVLNTGYPIGARLADELALGLAANVGKLCAAILAGEPIEGVCLQIERYARAIAVLYGIDLDFAVRSKFNATSEKVGLKTRMGASA